MPRFRSRHSIQTKQLSVFFKDDSIYTKIWAFDMPVRHTLTLQFTGVDLWQLYGLVAIHLHTKNKFLVLNYRGSIGIYIGVIWETFYRWTYNGKSQMEIDYLNWWDSHFSEWFGVFNLEYSGMLECSYQTYILVVKLQRILDYNRYIPF